eukprot:scaffold35012_cov214-Amphora_coffeaeformis.AAC.4
MQQHPTPSEKGNNVISAQFAHGDLPGSPAFGCWVTDEISKNQSLVGPGEEHGVGRLGRDHQAVLVFLLW